MKYLVNAIQYQLIQPKLISHKKLSHYQGAAKEISHDGKVKGKCYFCNLNDAKHTDGTEVDRHYFTIYLPQPSAPRKIYDRGVKTIIGIAVEEGPLVDSLCGEPVNMLITLDCFTEEKASWSSFAHFLKSLWNTERSGQTWPKLDCTERWRYQQRKCF